MSILDSGYSILHRIQTGLLFVLVATSVTEVKGQNVTHVRTLIDDLLNNYSPYVRPVQQQSSNLTVTVKMNLLSIKDFDEVKERLTLIGALFLEWNDVSMKWDPSSYGYMYYVELPYKSVWVPELVLTNPFGAAKSLGADWHRLRYVYNGDAYWNVGLLLDVSCSVNVRYFPFDVQTCPINYMPRNFVAKTEVDLQPKQNYIELDSKFIENGMWDILETSATTPADTSEITFTLKIKRKSTFTIVNIVLPLLLMGFLNILVFILPVDSGERISYAITVLLALAVFLTIVSDSLPKTSNPMSIMSYILMADLIVSSLICVVVIFTVRLYHRPEVEHVPKWLQTVLLTLKCNCQAEVVPENDTGEKKLFHEKEAVSNEGVYSMRFKAATKSMKVNEKQKDASEEDGQEFKISWKDVSLMLDKIAFTLFFLVHVILVAIFFGLTY